MKGIAIPYIIGLVIAIIVLAVAAYLIYLFVVQKKPLSCPECGAKFAAWCSNCYLKGWEGTNEMNDELKQCVDQDCGFWINPNNNCADAKEPCKGVGVPP